MGFDTPSQKNLLHNPGFESGTNNWNSNSALQVPAGWSLIWAEDDKWQQPLALVWEGNGVFWRDGSKTYAVRGYDAPIWARLSQRVDGLNPGEIYHLSLPIFPEIVAYYEPGKTYSGARDAAEVQIEIYSDGQQIFNSGLLDTRDFPVGRWSRMEVNFAPDGGDAEVYVTVRAPHANQFNGFFFDGASLTATGLFSPSKKLELEKIAEVEDLMDEIGEIRDDAKKAADRAVEKKHISLDATSAAFDATLAAKGAAEGIASQVTQIALEGYDAVIPFAEEATHTAIEIGGFAAIANEALAEAKVYVPPVDALPITGGDSTVVHQANYTAQLVIQNTTSQGMLVVWRAPQLEAQMVNAGSTLTVMVPEGAHALEINGPNAQQLLDVNVGSSATVVINEVSGASFAFTAGAE